MFFNFNEREIIRPIVFFFLTKSLFWNIRTSITIRYNIATTNNKRNQLFILAFKYHSLFLVPFSLVASYTWYFTRLKALNMQPIKHLQN
jgi:hypothetical protein